MSEFMVFPDGDSLARATAERFVTLAAAAIAARGQFVVALSGGSTPRAAYELLATEEFAMRTDWPHVHIFWGDERNVPPDHPDSNIRMAREALLDKVPIAASHIHRIQGYLEDYAHLIEGLLELYQTTFEPRWYVVARELAEVMIEHFSAPDGGFFDTSDDHERLIVRPRELQDNAVPSGNAMAALVLLRLAGLAVEPRYVDLALHSLGPMQPIIAAYPLGFGQWLTALDHALAHPREVAIVGEPDGKDTQALLKVCRTGYRPHQIVALGAPDTAASAVPLLRDRGQIGGQATAYVCVDFTCRRPVTDPEALQAHLEQES